MVSPQGTVGIYIAMSGAGAARPRPGSSAAAASGAGEKRMRTGTATAPAHVRYQPSNANVELFPSGTSEFERLTPMWCSWCTAASAAGLQR